MKIHFQADADFNEDIVMGVRRRVPEIDFKTASEAGLTGVADRMCWRSVRKRGVF